MSDNTRKDPQAHARAKADINQTLQTKVRELKAEASQLDQQIRDLETRAVREPDEGRVVELLAEKNKLVARKEALPVIMRGFQVRALHAQSAALAAEAEDIKPELETAQVDLEAAIKLVPELERRLEEARKDVDDKAARLERLSNNYKSLSSAAGLARADAGCIERGEPMKFEPNRFDGIC